MTINKTKEKQIAQQALKKLLPQVKQANADIYVLWQASVLIVQLYDASKAEPLYRRILKQNPHHANAAFALGSLLLEQDNDKGLALVQRAMAQDSRHVSKGVAQVRAYFHKHQRPDDAQRFKIKWQQPKPTPKKSPTKAKRRIVRPSFLFALIAAYLLAVGLAIQRYALSPQEALSLPASLLVTAITPYQHPDSSTAYLEQLHAKYRLSPDKRFIKTLSVLSKLKQDSNAAVDLVFSQGRWQVLDDDKMVATLAEYPDFPDLFALLQQWNTHIGLQQHWQVKQQPLPATLSAGLDKQMAKFFTLFQVQALTQLDQYWAKGGRELAAIAYAVRALTYMSLQHIDTLESAEQVKIQALAWLAVYRSLGGEGLQQEESLLAYELGYSSHARRIAKQLPKTNPVRAYVFHQHADLQQYIEAHPKERLSAYLYLRGSAATLGIEQWQAVYTQLLKDENAEATLLPAFALLNKLDKFSLRESIKKSTIYAAVVGLEQALAQSDPITDKMLKQSVQLLFNLDLDKVKAYVAKRLLNNNLQVLSTYLETRLTMLELNQKGLFLDAKAYSDYFRGFFYSGIHGLGKHYLDSLSSQPRTHDFTELLGNDAIGLAGEFQRWYLSLVAVKTQKKQPDSLRSEISNLQYLGAPSALRLLKEIKRYYKTPDPILWQSMRALVGQLDSRPAHVASHYWNVLELQRDKPLGIKLLRHVSSIDSANQRNAKIYLTYLNKDTTHMFALLNQMDTSPNNAAYGLKLLANMENLDINAVKEKFDALLLRYPNDYEVSYRYLQFTQKHGFYEDLRIQAEKQYQIQKNEPDLKAARMQRYIAKAYLEQGQLDKALKAASIAASTGSAWGMNIAADVLAAKGETEQAEALLQKVLERYSMNAYSFGKLVTFYWQQKQYDKAAKLALQIKSLSAWEEEIASEFVKIFAKQSEEAIFSAYHSIQKQGASVLKCYSLITQLGQEQPKIAMKLLEPLIKQTGGITGLQLLLRQYLYYKKVFGEQEAIVWLKQRLTPEQQPFFISIAMMDKEAANIVWLFEPAFESKTDHLRYFWLMRAASYIANPEKNSQHLSRLQTYYSDNQDNEYDVFGRYLLGMSDEQEVIDNIDSLRREGEASFFLGWRALAQGDHVTASDWFRITMETGEYRNTEYSWAYNILGENIVE